MGIELGRISGPLLARDLVRKNSGVGEENLAFETDLLYLDVINGRVGINTDTPSSPRKLDVNGDIRSTNLRVPTQFSTPNFVLSTNRIQNLVDKIYLQPNQATDPKIAMPKIGTANLRISDQLIENITNNSDINFSPNGDGITEVTTSELYVDGDLHSTGDITWDGDITFGNDDTDNVEFKADVNSHIIPNVNKQFDLGTSGKRWNKLYTKNLSADNLTYDTITVNNIDLLTTQGNTYYVSVNGSDSYVGDHLHNTFRTIKYALSQATAGDEVVIFPGTYEEIFPLTVPAGVTVNGAGIRAVTVKPTAGTNTNNAFLLNGESTVSHLTIKDFYNGYAFSFAPGFTVTSRSPYVQNITVITSGPNAGNGALVDGSLANSASREASMLFHSVTLIMPDAIGVKVTNGARVEWLDCFTYFTNKGIYLTQGTLGFASLGVKFGGELRSIGSANVYGTYGAVADGANTLAYLISHNFAYIGTGIDTTNDPKLVIQDKEVVESNNGRIHYESVDHKGDFRIGDIFYINQETGAVVFDAQAITFSPTGSISLEGPTSSAYIDYTIVQVGNIRIHDNNIDSLSGPVNFLANSGSTYLNTNVYVTGNTNVSADINIKGNLRLGDQASDTVTVYSNLTQDLLPDDIGPAGGYSLGNTLKRWNTLYSTELTVDNVTRITNNTISTLTSNTSLIISAAGTGKVQITDTDVQIANNLTVGGDTLTVNGTTGLRNVSLTGTIVQTGNWSQTGDAYLTGNTLVSNNKNLSITGTGSYFTVPNFKIQNNEISVTSTNQDLVLTGLGTGGVVFEDLIKFSGTQIEALTGLSLTESGALLITESGVPYALEGDLGVTESLVFQPNGTGNTVIDTTNAIRIPVGSNSTRTLSQGEIRYNSTSNLYEGGSLGGGLISFNGLYDSDRNTYITTGPTDNTIYFGINNLVKATINSTSLNSTTFKVDNIQLTGNTISNTESGADLIFAPDGTGNAVFKDVGFRENYIVNLSDNALNLASTGTGYVKFKGTNGLVVPIGNDSQRRNTPELGELRYNTQNLGVLEVFNGTDWMLAVGTNATISEADVLDILDLWTLILG
jgi:hypothetical protein